ncbi:Malate dehydrogenase [Rickettsia prowazekii str. Breinl]|nr:Malate dehydrogenase [Rickettsia prowazekii str. NMRC Madrid E]AGJ02460.1 Malate dehydrogenase [Rickettsia prowazekii str. Breinl]
MMISQNQIASITNQIHGAILISITFSWNTHNYNMVIQ